VCYKEMMLFFNPQLDTGLLCSFQAGKLYELGRAEPADLIIPIPTVSGRHAIVRVGELDASICSALCYASEYNQKQILDTALKAAFTQASRISPCFCQGLLERNTTYCEQPADFEDSIWL
jgi:hypothetical protein